MKLFTGRLGAAILILTFTGCGDETDTPRSRNAVPTADGRPAGFEDRMKGMGKGMQGTMTSSKGTTKASGRGASR